MRLAAPEFVKLGQESSGLLGGQEEGLNNLESYSSCNMLYCLVCNWCVRATYIWFIFIFIFKYI